MAPMGRQWFSFADRDPGLLLAGIAAAAPCLDAFLDAELARLGLADDRLALVGFSQGTMTALHVALRRPRPCALVVGFSGALVKPEVLGEEIVSRSEEHTSELQSLMRNSYAVFCLKKKNNITSTK